MKYYIRSDSMCSTNVVFNMKTVENVLIFFLEFLHLKHFWSLFSKFFLFIFTLRNCMPVTHKHRLRGSDGTDAWLMHKLHTHHVYHAISSAVLMCKTD